MQIHATPSTRLEGRLLYSERCRSRSSVSRHVVSAVVWPGAWFGGKNARPCLTEKAVDDPLTFSGRGHQGHIYIWTPLDVLWKDIRFLLEAWCSCWNNLAFLWKKTKGNKKQGDPGGRKFVMPLFRMLRWISRRSPHRRVLPDRMWLAQQTRSTVPGTMTNLFTRQLRHLILSMWLERECV